MLMQTESLWETFHERLKQFILKRMPDEQSTEDILQEVFLKIHARIETLRDEERLQSWIYQIARNAIVDYYRHYKATLVLSEALVLTMGVIHRAPTDDVVNELAPCIKAMVDSLPEEYRQALLLTAYEGLTQKEFGERVGISFSGAKSRVQRAREKLKALLLECCHFEFDRLGKVIDYQPKCTCCTSPDACSPCE